MRRAVGYITCIGAVPSFCTVNGPVGVALPNPVDPRGVCERCSGYTPPSGGYMSSNRSSELYLQYQVSVIFGFPLFSLALQFVGDHKETRTL